VERCFFVIRAVGYCVPVGSIGAAYQVPNLLPRNRTVAARAAPQLRVPPSFGRLNDFVSSARTPHTRDSKSHCACSQCVRSSLRLCTPHVVRPRRQCDEIQHGIRQHQREQQTRNATATHQQNICFITHVVLSRCAIHARVPG
jgi:hypothetical protein